MRHLATLCASAAAAWLLLGGGSTDAATRKKPQRVAQPTMIVCGQTGCFDVPPGCGYEMRRVGRGGVTAVVICDRK